MTFDDHQGRLCLVWSLAGALALLACGGANDSVPGAAGAPNAAGTAGLGMALPVGAGAPGVGGAGPVANGGTGQSSPGTSAGGAGPTQSPTGGASGVVVGSGGAVISGSGGTTPTGSGGTITAGSGGAAGSAAGAGGGGGAPPAETDFGKGDGSDVITIGDSWMNIITNGGGIEGALDRAGTKYRHYAVAGTTLINGDIPAQYNRAKTANPKIATVVMTAGGNDVMYTGGCATKEACAMSAQRIADALDQLWTKMATDGVTTTVYIQYSDNAGSTPSEFRPAVAPIPKICTTGKIRCLGVETTSLVGKTDTLDTIHPTVPACDRIAKATLDVMQMRGARR